jgi:hypothetical protein
VYQTDFEYWSEGWAYSNMQDDTTEGYGNMYASYANGGRNGSPTYGVGQQGSILRLTGADKGKPVKGLYVTNGTFAALSMKNGDFVGKIFGGISGDDPDYFALSVRAYSTGVLSNDSVAFYLADFRFTDNTQDYIIKDWTWMDLNALGNADSLVFTLWSSDTGTFGINTPTFFCVDDIATDSDTADFESFFLNPGQYSDRTNGMVTEVYTDGNANFTSSFGTSGYGNYWAAGFAISNVTDTITSGFENIYSAITGAGYNGSTTYAVAQDFSFITLQPAASGKQVNGFYITNSTYTSFSMKNGDSFAKKFGGVSGNDPDYFVLIVRGYLNGVLKTDTVNFYLADFRSADNSKDYIVNDWQWVDLTSLGDVDSISFRLGSSDAGQFGINTPGFFCIDNFTTRDILSGVANVKGTTNTMSVYPNPAKEMITIDGAGKSTTVTIMDITGKVVFEQAAKNREAISVASLSAGLYLLQITSDGVQEVKRLVIE